MKILCSGYFVRYPLGGQSCHHLQYLVGLKRLGHEVTFFEHFGWPSSCYNPLTHEMTSDPGYGVRYLEQLLNPYGLGQSWCYISEGGQVYGLSRDALAQACREADLYLNLSNINWIPELANCRRRVLVDTDPVFTQIGAHGVGGPFSRYQRLFTYGENVHREGCEMPTANVTWIPTRQPVVLDLWPAGVADPRALFTTVMNWSCSEDQIRDGRLYGQKNREFEPYFSLPTQFGQPMEIALNAPKTVRKRAVEAGWRLVEPRSVTRDPQTYQRYLSSSRGEFSVAKHAYVSTRSGWFSDRSTAYLALGRPIVVQDTGFTRFLPAGKGLLAFSTPREALAALHQVENDYEGHCRAARSIVEEYFDAKNVLTTLLEQSL